jgi:integrase
VQFLPSFENPTHVILTLPASKTDPFRKGISITIAAAPGRPSCPVTALKNLFTEIPNRLPTAPLFENPDGKPLSYTSFITAIRSALESAGLNPKLYAGHSFRRGAATEAAAAGYSDYEIQLLGRWRSDAYKLYIETSLSRILHLSSLLHMDHPHSIPFEPPALRDFTAMA